MASALPLFLLLCQLILFDFLGIAQAECLYKLSHIFYHNAFCHLVMAITFYNGIWLQILRDSREDAMEVERLKWLSRWMETKNKTGFTYLDYT